MSNQNQTISFTPEQLEAMLTRMAKEIRKPADPTPEQQAEAEMAKKMREGRAQAELAKAAERKLNQELCDHSREDGTPACVPVYNNQGNIDFLICQTNQCIIRPEPRPKGEGAKDTEYHIYNTQLFNRELRRALARRPATSNV